MKARTNARSRLSMNLVLAGITLLMGSHDAPSADLNPAHTAPNLAADLTALAGGAQVKAVWVQKQFISDDTTRFLECSDSLYIRWLFGGGPSTKLVGFDSREGVGRVLDSSMSNHTKPFLNRSGAFVIWNEMTAGKSWVMNWNGSIKKALITGGEYIALCTWYNATTGKEYVFAGGLSSWNEQLLGIKDIYRHEFDAATGSLVPGTKTAMWTKTAVNHPFTIASDGIHVGANMPWPKAYFAVLPNGTMTQVYANDRNAWQCSVNIAPDASSRFLHLEELHHQIAVYDATHTNPVWINLITRLPGADATWDCNGVRWTNDARYFTVFSPYEYWMRAGVKTHDCTKPVKTSVWKEGESGEMFFGKFNAQFNDAQLLRITDGDWRFRKVMGEAWVSSGEGPLSTETSHSIPSLSCPVAITLLRSHDGVTFVMRGPENCVVTVHSAEGRAIRSAVVTDGVLSLPCLNPGVYIVSATGRGLEMQRKILVR